MSRFSRSLIDLLSRALDPVEREFVLGDLAESGESARQTFRHILGLVLRRQSALLQAATPWLVLLGAVLPCGILFSLMSRRTADSSAVYLWLYANNWDWNLVANPGFRHQLATYASLVLLQYLTLFCWSWSAGFLLGALSRRSLPFHASLFVLSVLFSDLIGALPYHFGQALFYRARDFSRISGNSPIFDVPFYRVALPVIVQFALVLAPSLWGMSRAARTRAIRPLFRTVLWIAAIATLPAIAIRTGLASVPYIDGGITRSIAQTVAYWPIAYILACWIATRRGRKPVLN